jgi:hypothetical protein
VIRAEKKEEQMERRLSQGCGNDWAKPAATPSAKRSKARRIEHPAKLSDSPSSARSVTPNSTVARIVERKQERNTCQIVLPNNKKERSGEKRRRRRYNVIPVSKNYPIHK